MLNNFNPLLAILIWLGAAVVISGNGFVGKFLLEPAIGEYKTHVYKTIIGLVIVLLMGWIYAKNTMGAGWKQSCWTAGIFWLVLTLLFEFIAGHFLFGNPWEKLFNDYRIWAGRLWLLFLIALVFAPVIMGGLINKD